MKSLAIFLLLLLAVPAMANSMESSLCGATSSSVERMSQPEKLCRASARSLSDLPAATAVEMGAMLTPENLANMAAMTSLWLGSQGVPVVGEAVDAALLSLGLVLLAIQAGEVTEALWRFANHALTARSEADLRKAASALAGAISKVGINIVAFVLTKKLASKATKPRAPPTEPPALTSGGTLISEAMGTAQVSTVAPAVMAGGVLSQGTGNSSSGEPTSKTKRVDSKAFEEWIAKAKKKPVQEKSPASNYQVKHAGPDELTVQGGGTEVRADGARASDAHLLEVKHVDSPDTSPYIPGSKCHEKVRQLVRKDLIGQFERYAHIIRDPATPAVGLEVITNDARAAAFFETLLREANLSGTVVVRP